MARNPRQRSQVGGCSASSKYAIDVSPGAQHFISEHMEKAALEMFLRMHKQQLPRNMRAGYELSSNVRSGGRVYLTITTRCTTGRLHGYLHTPGESI